VPKYTQPISMCIVDSSMCLSTDLFPKQNDNHAVSERHLYCGLQQYNYYVTSCDSQYSKFGMGCALYSYL